VHAEAICRELLGLDREFSVGLVGPRGSSAECLNPLILIVCIDNDFAKDPAALSYFKRHVDQQKPVIPLILPGYEVRQFDRWWPGEMPEMERFALFVGEAPCPMTLLKIFLESSNPL
jgi:hypothetical protein